MIPSIIDRRAITMNRWRRRPGKSGSIELARSLNPELQSYEQWLAAAAKTIPLGCCPRKSWC